ncbi:hematopoietic SH2 domain-containing protein homolog isoform X2 [Siniperca chuatsi]|uniref:hematopoietic SH2 domain-containing protein homolog isoform X2 n=1 Tax=Siniperca chuatsi TaxID=119488 RepID=UPI001CE0DB87|nr:hematopoietic SH2 domain-containing protein homolog isoform X2 [Siniperca chuatsi]
MMKNTKNLLWGGLNEPHPRMMEWSQSLQGQHDAFTWFTQSQLQSVIKNGIVPEWFHGIISRKTAEELLMSKPPGYFLIRVSESRIGYTLSYCAGNRCRHFMIDVLEDGHYTIVGENRRHRFLQDLVDFHRRNPIMPFTEVLTVACGQALNDKTDYAELLFPQRHPNPNTSLLPNNSLHASPVPMTRNRHTADNPPSNQPPEVPARRSVPPLKQNQACIRTVSAPDSPSTPTATEHPFGTNIQSVKNQEAKLSLVTNIKNLKKKFQKKRSTSQENMYAEINVEATDRSGNTENECQEMTGEQTFNGPPFSYTCTHVRLTDGELPQEYLPPPPFAPGY